MSDQRPIGHIKRAADRAYPTTTTTTSFSVARIRGLALDLLNCLHGAPLTVIQLSEILERKPSYIRPYLHSMKKRGLVEKLRFGAWTLTPLGDSLYLYLYLYLYSKRKDKIRDKIRKRKDKVKIERRLEEDSPTPTRQLSIEPWLVQSDPSHIEVVVVDYLVSHYNRTGRKYILAADQYELAERFNCSPTDLREALAKLDEEHRIYFTDKPDRRYGKHRLGLQKWFIEWLDNGGR